MWGGARNAPTRVKKKMWLQESEAMRRVLLPGSELAGEIDGDCGMTLQFNHNKGLEPAVHTIQP